jgi:hypothetical protein
MATRWRWWRAWSNMPRGLKARRGTPDHCRSAGCGHGGHAGPGLPRLCFPRDDG